MNYSILSMIIIKAKQIQFYFTISSSFRNQENRLKNERQTHENEEEEVLDKTRKIICKLEIKK